MSIKTIFYIFYICMILIAKQYIKAVYSSVWYPFSEDKIIVCKHSKFIVCFYAILSMLFHQ